MTFILRILSIWIFFKHTISKADYPPSSDSQGFVVIPVCSTTTIDTSNKFHSSSATSRARKNMLVCIDQPFEREKPRYKYTGTLIDKWPLFFVSFIQTQFYLLILDV